MNNVIDISIIAKDLASSVLKGVNDNIKKTASGVKQSMAESIESFQNAVKTFGSTALLGASAGLTTLGGLALKSADDFEKAQLKYEVLLGSQEKAAERAKEIAEYAAKTPFSIKDITKGDLILQGFGIRTEKLLKTIGNAAAVSETNFGELSLILGQLSQSKDLQNIRQLAERGIVTFNELKEAGIKFAKDGSVVNSVDETYTKVVEIIEKKFRGGAEKISGTLSGQISTLLDNANIALGKFVTDTGILEGAKKLVAGLNQAFEGIDWDGVIEIFNDIKDGVINAFETITESEAFQVGKEAIKNFVNYLIENKDATVMAISAIGLTILATFVPAMVSASVAALPFIVVLGLIAVAVFTLKKAWDNNFLGIQDIWNNVWNKIKPKLDELWGVFVDRIIPALTRLWEKILPALEKAWLVLEPIIKRVLAWIGVEGSKHLDRFVDGLTAGVNFVADLLDKINEGFDTVKSFLKMLREIANLASKGVADFAKNLKIPGFAVGTNYYGGGLALVGERGPELVHLPRGSKVSTASESKQMLSGGGGDINIYNTFNNAEDPHAVAMRIAYQARNLTFNY
jgi:hypothetical protein